METKDSSVNIVPTFWELPVHLRKKLIKEFTRYVISQIRFRHYIMFFSFWALAFQTHRLLWTYLEFETVVKVDISKPFDVDVPGVTICTDKYHMVLKSKLERRYPELKEQIKNMKANNATEDQLLEVYREYKQIAYENSTIGQWFELLVEPEMLLQCKMLLKPMWYKDNGDLPMPNCTEYAKPYYNLPFGSGICWTYFSQINPNDYHWSQERVNYYRIDVERGVVATFRVTFEAFNDIVADIAPYDEDNENNLPELSAVVNHPRDLHAIISLDRANLRPGTNYDILFSTTSANLLNYPYVTNCREYEKEKYWSQFKSNYQCIDKCLSDKMLSRCHCVFNQSRGERFTTWKQNTPESNLKFCKEREDKNGTERDVCANSGTFVRSIANSECSLTGICFNNCTEEYYRYEIKQHFWDQYIDGRNASDDDFEDMFGKPTPSFPKAKPTDSFATFNVKRKDVADITYQHMPEMIFVEFVCYFGGLLGLWLGVSILDVYNMCLVWYDEAPGHYKDWLERQKFSTNVMSIKANKKKRVTKESNPEIAIVSHNNVLNNQGISDTTVSDYNTQYSKFNTQYNSHFNTQRNTQLKYN